MSRAAVFRRFCSLATAGGLLLVALSASAQSAVERGRYLTAASGCAGCHTEDREDAVPFAGGRAIKSAFGTFYSPNITPDRETGIGNWSDTQFVAALHDGIRPDGASYFPAFPFPSYTGMTTDDALDIKAYLFSLPAVRQANRAHELPWYLRSRLAARAWKLLYFQAGRFAPDPSRDDSWNRGAYLVRHLGHCGQCHTPRSRFGALIADRELAGSPSGVKKDSVPNVTPHEADGIGTWSAPDLELFLEIGMLPDGDFAGAGMGQVIDENTSQLTGEDRSAIATYLRALPALPDKQP